MPNVNEYMLKQADAEAIYQKKLNAGTGINIDPITDTISATGSGGSTVTYTPNVTTGMILGILGINGTSNPIKSPSLIAGQNVSITQDQTTGALTFSSVNTTYNDMVGADGTDAGTHGLAPAPGATDNTKFLKGDGSWSDPVTANPVAAATATLSKLSINNTVYDLAGGTTTYFGTTDPSNSVGNNGDLYFKYTSTPITVEKEITLPTIPYGQNTYIEIADFSSYTDFTFTYTDVYSASLEKTVSISDIPESNDPLSGSNYAVYMFNAWLYLLVGKDSNGLWVARGENCSFTKLVGTYVDTQIDITKAFIKIDGKWVEQPSGGGGGGGTGSFVGLTKSQYDALPTSEKEDVSKLYLVQEGGGDIVIEPVDLSEGTTKNEYSMTITKTATTITDSWSGASTIGAEYRSIAIDVTNVDELTYELVTTTCYDHNNANVEEQATVRFQVQVCLFRDISYSGWMSDNMANAITYNTHKYTNTTYTSNECKIDTSNLTGIVYVVINMHGWNLTFSNLSTKSISGAEITRHTYWNNAKWAQWNQVKELTQAEYNALSTSEKQNGNLYLTHDGGYDFISYDNGKIVVRVNNTTGQTLWFFNGFTKEAADMTVPSELVPYLPTKTSSISVMMAKSWTDDTSTSTNGWVGFIYPGTSNVKIRSWTSNGSQLRAGTSWAVLDIDGSTAEFGQTANYSAPTEGLSLLPNRIYFNGTKYAENSASGSGSNYSRTVLYNTNVTSAGQFTLNDDITNYDEIEIVVGFTSNAGSKTTFKFNSAWFKNEFPYVATPSSTTSHFLACVYASYYIRLSMGDADNKLYMTETASLMIEEVAGITY